MYSDPRVVDYVERHFVPVRVHVKEDADSFQELGAQYNAQWTPTTLVIDHDGREQHRIEGFLPAHDFLSQLALGIAKAAFARKDYAIAAPSFREVADEYGDTDAGPEALYWTGVSQYRATNDALPLRETAKALREKYPSSTWTKKASVWAS